ncbi:exodeoxyribonuclease VII large subunit [Zoogloeaceae bacterium G21618-S1]|nr:exodeoxyribonuclease VII large subunit [Zoogloeaceae bacterium G21618-S1]
MTLSVSDLNRLAREALETGFPPLWVQGELSNVTHAPSGHIYFTLKDAGAQVRCTLWRSRAQRISISLRAGMQVELRAQVTLYEPRGDYQLSVESVREAGVGHLFDTFVRLKSRLEAEGLFAAEHKRSPPHYPRGVAIISSPQAAALKDVCASFARRAPHLKLVLLPTPVQGDGAGARIAAALDRLARIAPAKGLDVVLLVRGGGSIEDLWAFNEEVVARAIRRCALPVISGVGHETDFTIADFAADLRATTPTAAAELASAGFYATPDLLDRRHIAMQRAMQRRLNTAQQQTDRIVLRLTHPRQRLADSRAAVNALARRMRIAMTGHTQSLASQRAHLGARLSALRPTPARYRPALDAMHSALRRTVARQLSQRRSQLDAIAAHLDHLNPEAVLSRGYSITRDENGRILREAAATAANSDITVQLHRGKLIARITHQYTATDND